ncbi:hypothetical protein RUND412_007773 [Rhizina undulata]
MPAPLPQRAIPPCLYNPERSEKHSILENPTTTRSFIGNKLVVSLNLLSSSTCMTPAHPRYQVMGCSKNATYLATIATQREEDVKAVVNRKVNGTGTGVEKAADTDRDEDSEMN